MNNDIIETSAIIEILEDRLNFDELKNLAIDLFGDYENIPHNNKIEFARELCLKCKRHNRLDEIILKANKINPQIVMNLPYLSSNHGFISKSQAKLSVKNNKQIFISYSRKDVEYKNELKKHLNILSLMNIADNWSCEEINIGNWHSQIQSEIKQSDIIIYMLSANFFSSLYILEEEVQKGMEFVLQNPNKKILCVIVSDFIGLDKLKSVFSKGQTNLSLFQSNILKLADWQYLPYGTVKNNVTGNYEEKIIPLKRFNDVEIAFVQITEKIIELLR